MSCQAGFQAAKQYWLPHSITSTISQHLYHIPEIMKKAEVPEKEVRVLHLEISDHMRD